MNMLRLCKGVLYNLIKVRNHLYLVISINISININNSINIIFCHFIFPKQGLRVTLVLTADH